MKRMMWWTGALILVAAVAVAGCGKGTESAPPSNGGTTSPPAMTDMKDMDMSPAAAGEIAQKMCPVMGGPINPSIYVDYNGRRVYFCCTDCVSAFKKDPAKYLAKVDEELKQMTMPAAGHKAPDQGSD